jgi:hypothetical protein
MDKNRVVTKQQPPKWAIELACKLLEAQKMCGCNAALRNHIRALAGTPRLQSTQRRARSSWNHLMEREVTNVVSKLPRGTVLLVGDATGGDAIARSTHAARGGRSRVFNAYWGLFGNDAGPVRNSEACAWPQGSAWRGPFVDAAKGAPDGDAPLCISETGRIAHFCHGRRPWTFRLLTPPADRGTMTVCKPQ